MFIVSFYYIRSSTTVFDYINNNNLLLPIHATHIIISIRDGENFGRHYMVSYRYNIITFYRVCVKNLLYADPLKRILQYEYTIILCICPRTVQVRCTHDVNDELQRANITMIIIYLYRGNAHICNFYNRVTTFTARLTN